MNNPKQRIDVYKLYETNYVLLIHTEGDNNSYIRKVFEYPISYPKSNNEIVNTRLNNNLTLLLQDFNNDIKYKNNTVMIHEHKAWYSTRKQVDPQIRYELLTLTTQIIAGKSIFNKLLIDYIQSLIELELFNFA